MLVRSPSLAIDTTSMNMRTALIYILLLCGTTLALSIPSISVHPADAVVRPGTAHVLHCAAGTNVEVQISWSHNGVVIESTDPSREILANNSLRIASVDANTMGQYACHVSNDLGTVTSRQALIQMAFLNGNNQPTEQKVTKSAGDTLMLGCGEYNSVPEATVTWIRRDLVTDIQKQSLGDNVATSVESGILYFRNLEKSHNGLYQCVISNSLTDNSIVGSYILTVNDTQVVHPQSQIALPPSNIVVNRGDNANFQCITEGSPLPTITWSRIVQGNNSLLVNNIVVNDEAFLLTVVNVQPADVGDYICNASNGVGQLVATLKIRDAPVLTSTPANNTHSVKFGDDLQLSCSANGTLPIKLTWFYNGVELVTGGRVVVEPLGRLTVRNTSTSSDAGVYQCYAENEAGFDSHAVLVDVFIIPPSFTVGLTDVVLFEGDPLLLECQATSAPPPQYTWYRGNIALDSINRYDTSTPGKLRMTDVSRDQAGTYNCSVSSVDNGVAVGRNSTTARVFVVPPSVFVATTPRQLAEQEGNNITLPCSVNSDASTTTTYSWMRDNQPVVVDERVSIKGGDLVITELRPTDAGRYTCVVSTQVTNSLNAQPRVLLSNVSILSVSAFPVAPGTPVAVEIRQSSVLLEWSYDGDNRQISHFQVERRQFGTQDWTVFGTVGALATTQVNATSLYPFTVYQFRVLSVNNNDVSSPSEPSELVVTREAAPTAAPFNVIVVDSNYTAIVVAWEHPPLRLGDGTGRNGIIVSYEVKYTPVGRSGSTVTLRTSSNATLLLINGLEQRVVYEVSIAAITSQGVGPATVARLPTMGAVTGTEDSGEEFHEQTWFIVAVVLVGLITVTIVILMMVCVVRSVRNNKNHEGKYNVEGIKDGHITTGVLNKDVVEDYENRRTTHLMKYSLSNDYQSNASLITDNVTMETQSNAASTLPAPPYIPPPSFASLGHCSSLSTIDRPVMSRSGNGWNNFVITESSDVFEEACSSINKVPSGSESDEYDGKCSSVSTSNKCATFV